MVAFLAYFFKFDIKNRTDLAFVIVLLGCFIFQIAKVYPYTLFAKYEIQDASMNYESSFSIYTANVLQDNENVTDVLADAQKFDADIILFTETDKIWQRLLSEKFGKRYKVEIPLSNTYGMLLYSKLELVDAKVMYMVEDTIPSIHAKIILPSKDTLQLFAIHPAPPTPQHNPSSVDRDAEMMKIAKLTRESLFPVIVIGDFNDVAWSETTELFQKVSGLLDLRKGRGLFNTYNAKSFLMRWPLDHIFSSPEFRILDLKLGKNTSSDHYPFFTRLSFEPEYAIEQKLPEPSRDQLKTAFEQIEKEAENSE
tara:strand:+ start:210 stop:1139 length:930 start_codon:yes stop_codon:yes gene_type:complete